jgi:epoxyqueuosine reductase
MKLKEITEKVRCLAIETGFCACGFSKAMELPADRDALLNRISNGYTAEMKYLENNLEKRADPRKLIEKAKTVISVMLSYYPSNIEIPSGYYVSAYARGNDYHEIIKSLLEKFLIRIKEIIPEVNGRTSCDSGPIFERAWAKNAGLGWIGKNAILINPEAGSFVFLGEVIIDKELVYDVPVEEQCGSCTLCMEACPTNALVAPYTLNATKCITYHTVEKRTIDIPQEVLEKLGKRVYACDVCQDVCPYNKSADKTLNKFFIPNTYVGWTNNEWETLDEEKFAKHFNNTSIKKIGIDGLRRNITWIKNKASIRTSE